MSKACIDCGQPRQGGPRALRCADCAQTHRLASQRAYQAARTERERAHLATLPPDARAQQLDNERAAYRARYRAKNPPPPCSTCGKPTARRNQLQCDSCAPDAARRQYRRESAKVYRQVRKTGATHLCVDCQGPVIEPRLRRCATCRAAWIASKPSAWAAYAARETPEQRAERVAYERQLYRARNPTRPCRTCKQPLANNNQVDCDRCCSDLDARSRKRAARQRARLKKGDQ